jgi:hypothetical protein
MLTSNATWTNVWKNCVPSSMLVVRTRLMMATWNLLSESSSYLWSIMHLESESWSSVRSLIVSLVVMRTVERLGTYIIST